ncbi:MAG: translation elongation factor Ts [Cytophagales bacterium]|nr:translation elongation factor Ts [Cytophagales bacterium]MDW8384742.1 translation elongation factor Ts [Flammeovirgaceae bacterium]
MAITAAQVNELRQRTGAGMMDCKKALEEAQGDFEKAIDILRVKGQKIAAKRADKEAKEGKAYAYVNESGTVGIAFTLNCETEPVSNTDEFLGLGQMILKAAIANKPKTVPELLSLSVDGVNISEKMTELSGKMGEKLEIAKYALIEGEKIVSYVHANKVAVLVNLIGTNGIDVTEAGKDVAMQIAAMNPVAVDENSVAPEIIEREKQVGIERARQEGKPEAVLAKIAEGYVKKFLQENTLLSQTFVKDAKISVKQYLESIQKGLTVKSFARLGVGR